jgi:hypothetical protein
MQNTRRKTVKKPNGNHKTLPLLSIPEQICKAALADILRKNGGIPPSNNELAAATNYSKSRISEIRADLTKKGHYVERAEVVA